MTPMSQKRLLLVGATGMVGGYALRYALEKRRSWNCYCYRAPEARYFTSKAGKKFCILTSPTAPHSRKRFQVRTR